jgi:hypothetical protein
MEQAVEAHRVVRRRGSRIFLTMDSQMAVRFSALRADRPRPIECQYHIAEYVQDVS